MMNDWVGPLRGHPQVQTPHMDRLAERGTVFTSTTVNPPFAIPPRRA